MRLFSVLCVLLMVAEPNAAQCTNCNLRNRVQSVPVQSIQSVPVQSACVNGSCSVSNVVQQVVPTQVAYVPAQVYYNGQALLYDQSAITASGLGYSYQPANSDMMRTIDNKLDILINALTGKNDTVDPTPVQPSSIPKQLPTLKNTNIVVPPPQQPQKLGWKAILQNSCVKCHGINSTNGLTMVDDKGQILDKLPRLKIYQAVTLPVKNEEHMPKNGPSLPRDQIETLRDWARSGLIDLDY